MERPEKRLQEILDDPAKQLKLALKGRLDEIQIDDFVYVFSSDLDPDTWGNDTIMIYAKGVPDYIGYYNTSSKILYASHPQYKAIHLVRLVFPNFRGYPSIDDDAGILTLRFIKKTELDAFLEQYPNQPNDGISQVFIHDRNLVERLKNIVVDYYKPFVTLLRVFNPSFKKIQFSVNSDLKYITADGTEIFLAEFKFFPSLNTLAWKKMTPQQQRDYNIFAPNECRICQKPTNVMCSLTKIPFCSQGCQRIFSKKN